MWKSTVWKRAAVRQEITAGTTVGAARVMQSFLSHKPPSSLSLSNHSFSTNASSASSIKAAAHDDTPQSSPPPPPPPSSSSPNSSGPSGTLFHAPLDSTLLHKHAEIRRTFDAQSNAQGLLVCGGTHLAKHASFDPLYRRAQTWIRHHAVGPAVLSPLLTTGLIQALVEATLPQAIVLSTSIQQLRPLIVGVQVCARIQVSSVLQDDDAEDTTTTTTTDHNNIHNHNDNKRSNGYQVVLQTSVARVRDGAMIATGTHDIWIPDYLRM